MSYPTGTDLQTFLQGAKIVSIPPTTEQALLSYSDAMDAAIEEWEDLAGRHPFLADTADSTRYFDPPQPTTGNPAFLSLWTYTQGGMELDITPGLASLTSVMIGTTSFDIGGNGVIGAVYPYPENYSAIGKPISKIRFVWSGFGYGTPESIAITGKWGAYATLPKVVKLSLLKRGALKVLPALSANKTGGVVEIKQENLTRKYGTMAWAGTASTWEREVRAENRRYKAKAFA